MRTSTVLSILAAVAAAAIGFLAGRAITPDGPLPLISEPAQPRQQATGSFPSDAAADRTMSVTHPRTELLRALRLPEPERGRAVRAAMNAWLVAEGAAAITAARGDPELDEVANRMLQLAVYVYPEVIVDNPDLLEGMSEQSIAMAVSGVVTFNPDAARAMIDTHLSGSMFGDAMLSMVDQVAQGGGFPPQPLEDPRAELESILAERSMMNRLPRLQQLVTRMAAEDPVAAAELVDDMPGSLKRHAVQTLVEVWSRTNPEEAARWLADKSTQVAEQGFSMLAWRWGQDDLDAANAFADTLTGRKRNAFLSNLANATSQSLSRDEMLAWVSRYENDPVYPNLVMSVAQRLAQGDIDAALELIETLPEAERMASYGSVVSSLAYQDPEAAIALVDEIEDASARGEMLPMISSVWGYNDADAAMDWALDLEPGLPRDHVFASLSQSLMGFDMDRAIDAIDEIEDPEVREGPVRRMLFTVESDDEAVRIGRDFGYDRDAVLEMRELRRGVPVPGFFAPYSRAVSVGEIRVKVAETE